ncbi:MAG: lactate 2-monooxygenase [Verrucomicrobia bacterium]|nr:lactate 2-monooxygenase [Verrucomicrobiota bacterium]
MSQPKINFANQRQTDIYLDGAAGRLLPIPVDPHALERAARGLLPPPAFDYLAGGAGLERTMQANRDAFDRWRIVPRMLRDVAEREPGVELFGRRIPSPILTAPVGVLELAHAEADLAVVRAAAACGVPAIFSNQASVPMEQCAAAMGSGPRWFQLYWSKSNDLVASFVQRAERCGCEAIVVTLDTTMLGWRTRDLDHAFLPFLRGMGIAQYTSDPVFQKLVDAALAAPPTATSGPKPSFSAVATLLAMARRHPGGMVGNLRSGRARAAVRTFVGIYSRPSLTWADLPFLRQHTKLPILLKGLQHPDDARRALDAGIDGLIVSNHGGRQVDGAIGSLDALPAIAEAVAGRVPILFDSGIRTGADIFKALALGARAVLLGRPVAYALAVAGQAGVETLLKNYAADFELTMGLAGCRTTAEITAECLVRSG